MSPRARARRRGAVGSSRKRPSEPRNMAESRAIDHLLLVPADGSVRGNHFGFSAVASLDANPFDIKRLFEERGLRITSYCAHSALLDATAPWRYGTGEIIKAVRAAGAIGVPHVITTEGEPET